MLPFLALFACQEEEKEEIDNTPRAAELTPLSSGDCPDMSQSGQLTTFVSSGEERNVVIVYPDQETEDMRLIFFFHGLMPANSDPATQTASSLQFQTFANTHNAVIVIPESPIWDLMGQRFHLWNIEDGNYDSDLALFDDLRTCVAEEFSIDLNKLVSSGFSGGSLFNTILLSQRADTLAAVIEFSGGADLTVPLFENPFAPYSTPSSDVPVLLVSGGEDDIWPDAQFTLVDFDEATDTLQANLLADGQFVVRCRHTTGHNITLPVLEAGFDWMLNHEFGKESPYKSGISWEADCEIP